MRAFSGSDDRGTETAKVRADPRSEGWMIGRLGGQSSAEDGRVMPKLVTGIPEAVGKENPEAMTLLAGG